jgi:dihydropteroate synthase
MQSNTEYADVFNEVDLYLQSRAAYALSCGIAKDKIILDPGIGFGKNLDANRVLIKRCGELCGGMYPVLMALSRKTCIGEITGRAVEERLAGTLAANMLSVMYGASIVRVHDVPETVDCLKTLRSVT